MRLPLRVTHLPFEVGLFLWHVASIFFLLLACWELAGIVCEFGARWGGVCLVAALLTIPVAGTALYIMDQYLNPRNLAAFAAVFAVARVLEKKYVRALLWLVFAACVHPLMAAFAFLLCALLLVMGEIRAKNGRGRISPVGPALMAVLLLPFGISLDPPSSPAYHEAALHHGFHYIQRWQWYEWLGILAPLLLFWWFAGLRASGEWRKLDRCAARSLFMTLFISWPRWSSIFLCALRAWRVCSRCAACTCFTSLMFLFVGGFLANIC